MLSGEVCRAPGTETTSPEHAIPGSFSEVSALTVHPATASKPGNLLGRQESYGARIHTQKKLGGPGSMQGNWGKLTGVIMLLFMNRQQ